MQSGAHSDTSETLSVRIALCPKEMSHISFALYDAHQNGASIEVLADKLDLPTDFVEERIEAARLCLMMLNHGDAIIPRYPRRSSQAVAR